MAISRKKKGEISDKIDTIVGNSNSVVFVNFHGLSVAKTNEMRRALKEKNVRYTVAKKTLIKRILDSKDIRGERPTLEGELALAYGEDQVAPAKSIFEFQKKNEGMLAALGGILDGKYITADEVKNLAKIPGRQVLYGQFVTIINTPVQQIVQVLNAVTESFVRVLDQIKQQKV